MNYIFFYSGLPDNNDFHHGTGTCVRGEHVAGINYSYSNATDACGSTSRHSGTPQITL